MRFIAKNLVLFILFSLTTALSAEDFTTKNPNDLRKFRQLKLKNGLEVLLISNPAFNKSAASLDVRVGSLKDPKDKMGLAHFLEHVLFLGTKTFPEPDNLFQYLSAHQGSSNAFTASESTNFQFEVNHDGFEEALHRFSLFFIEPTFNSKYVSKELNAVNSEYKKNIDIDSRRIYRVQSLFYKKEHAINSFSVGNKETLAKVSLQDMKDFYNKYYSANIMKLALLSNRPLNEMEKLAKKYFSPIKNKNLKPNIYSEEVYPKDFRPHLIQIKPEKDLKELEISFQIPSTNQFWQSKPHNILGHLFGHEGKGSLLSYLKRKNLATGVSAGSSSYTFTASFNTTIKLTDYGVDHFNEVIQAFFSYVNLLKENGYKEYIFEEEKKTRELEYKFKDHEEGSSVAVHFAHSMQTQPALSIEKRLYLLDKYSKEDFNKFLSYLKPENTLVTLITKKAKTDKKEHFYGVEYGSRKFTPKETALWTKKLPSGALSYPQKNPYIPKNIKLIKSNDTKRYKLIDSNQITYWFQFDNEFKLPKSEASIRIYMDQSDQSPKARAIRELYVDVINTGLEEWKYPIILAGLSFNISPTDYGLSIHFSGFSESMPKVIHDVIQKLKEITIDEKMFETIKTNAKSSIANFHKVDAYKQAMNKLNLLSKSLSVSPYTTYDPLAKPKAIDYISDIKLNDIRNYANSAFNHIYIEGALYGNIDRNVVKNTILNIPKSLKSKTLPKKKRLKNKNYNLPVGKPLAVKIHADVNNVSWVSYVQFGKRTPKLRAATAIGNSFFETDFFRELRTKQQLGYIVWSGDTGDTDALGIKYIIQSGNTPVDEIAKRVAQWRVDSLERFKKLPAKMFNQIKQAVATKYREKSKTMGERLSIIMYGAYEFDGNFKFREDIAKAAENSKQIDVIRTFKRALNPKNEKSVTVYLLNKKSKDFSPREKLISDEKAYKRKTKTY